MQFSTTLTLDLEADLFVIVRFDMGSLPTAVADWEYGPWIWARLPWPLGAEPWASDAWTLSISARERKDPGKLSWAVPPLSR